MYLFICLAVFCIEIWLGVTIYIRDFLTLFTSQILSLHPFTLHWRTLTTQCILLQTAKELSRSLLLLGHPIVSGSLYALWAWRRREMYLLWHPNSVWPSSAWKALIRRRQCAVPLMMQRSHRHSVSTTSRRISLSTIPWSGQIIRSSMSEQCLFSSIKEHSMQTPSLRILDREIGESTPYRGVSWTQ